ncbi:MAG: efflux RND transporter permease subunit [Candidatus Saccharibacteria bacterium]
MRITELAIKRPAMMTMIIMVFVILGLYTYGRIGVELFPAINIPYVSVSVSYPGAGAEEIEGQIIKPIEDTLASLSGIKHINSQASAGSGSVGIEFDMSADVDKTAMDVQKKIDAIKGRLPDGAGDPVVFKMDMNDMPILSLGLNGKRPPYELYKIAEDIVKEKLQTVPGVTQVNIVGGQQREVQIHIDKSKMEGFNLSLNQVTNRLKTENLNDPSGRLDRPEAEYNVRVLGEYRSVEDIQEIQIPTSSGYAVPLKEIATVIDGYTEMRQRSRLNGISAVGLQVSKQSDASVVAVGDAAKKELENIQKELPSDCQLVISNDQSLFVRQSLNGTVQSIIEGIIVTGLVLFLFLRKWRSTFIVMLAIPTSLLATVMMMYFAGFTFNMMSMMGLALCIGILVDDSIVVLENIDRHLNMGKLPWQAALDGRSEIGMAAIAITASDVVVFAPIAFMTGMIGQMFKQFGLTIVFATLFSLFISFTMTPMLASLLYKPVRGESTKEKRRSIFSIIWDVTVPLGARIKDKYVDMLHWSLSHRALVIIFSISAFVLSCFIPALGLVGTEFTPKTDQGQLNVNLELPVGTPIGKTDAVLKRMEKKLSTIPEIQYYQSSLGSSGGRSSAAGSNIGRIGVRLTPKGERKRTLWEIGDTIRSWSGDFKEAKLTVTESDQMGGGGGSAVQIVVSGKDPVKLVKITEDIKKVVERTPGAADINTNFRMGQPEVEVIPDRSRVAFYGLSINDIARTVRTAINGESAGVLRQGDEETDITVDIEGADKSDIDNIKNLQVTGTSGSAPLQQVADVTIGSGPTDIRRVDRQRTITITGNIRNRPQGDFMNDVQARIAKMNLPHGFSVNYQGQQQSMQESFADLLQALVLSIVLVYMVLVMLYESFSTPLIRMLSLPLGIVGAFVALAITRSNINIMSLIGIIMLDGLVAKNGTLLIDYTHTLIERGRTLREALVEAGITRLRPIIMTTATMVMGMLPTALALSEGAEFRSSMAWVLIGGLLTSTLFTLFVIPVVYTLIDDWKAKRGKGRGRLEARFEKDVVMLEDAGIIE